MVMDNSTIFIVDDDAEACRSLNWLIQSVSLPARSFNSARAFLDACDPEPHGCLLLDMRMPVMDGLQLQAELTQRKIELPIIFVSAYADVSTTVRAMRAGAVTVVKKPYSDQVVLEHVQQALRDDADRRQLRDERQSIDARIASLSARQRQVLDMIVDGAATKRIAFRLGLSPRTIEIHRAHVMAKIHADTVATLVRLVMKSSQRP
jgi:two-component system response regulator FixJ